MLRVPRMPREKKDAAAVKLTTSEILAQAGKRAIGGGVPGAAAMGMQVYVNCPPHHMRVVHA